MPIFSLKMQNISAHFRVGEGLGRGSSNSRIFSVLQSFLAVSPTLRLVTKYRR
jgi:hypothetical protein